MFLRKQFENSPAVARVAPFAVFLLLTFCQGKFFAGSEYWFYLAKTLVGACLIWAMRPFVAEMRWTISVEAIAVGVGVFVMWVVIDPYYPKLGELTAKAGLGKAAGAELPVWNPHLEFGRDSIPAWLFMAVRVLGMGLVVPPLEEVFYRSFLYRYIARPDFQSVPLARFYRSCLPPRFSDLNIPNGWRASCAASPISGWWSRKGAWAMRSSRTPSRTCSWASG
jgi:CAAX prenyl protease-like protein